MLGWEFPPFMAGGLGIHCLEITQRLAAMGTTLDFYMPHMESLEGGVRVADHHKHLRIVEVEADPGITPYGANASPQGSGSQASRKARYEANFNAAVHLYNQRLVDAFDSHDADVLHCHDWITMEAGLELRRRTGIPLVVSVHSTEFDRSAGFAPQTWIEAIERRGVHGADHVIAVSQYTKDLVVRLYDVAPGKVTAVHNGVDFEKFVDCGNRDYSQKPGLAEKVLFLSRLSRQKGPLYFLETARRVLERRPQTRFVVAGKGEMLRECVDYCVRHGIADRVEFTGFVPVDDLAAFYEHHDLYVLPSVSEPFGISVLEAMASGLPTLVSRSSGVGEAVQHALKADYWDTDEMADLILRLLESEAMRRELGRNGAREARRFTWEACARKTLGVYAATAALAPPSTRTHAAGLAAPRMTTALAAGQR